MLSAGVPRPSGTWHPQAWSADPPGMPAAGLPWPPGGARRLSPGPPAPDPAAAAEAAAPAPASQAPAAASLLCSRGPEAATCNHCCLRAAGQRPPAAPHLTHRGHRRPSPALRSRHPPGTQQALGRPAPARPRSLRLLHLLQLRCSPSLPLPGSVPATLLPAGAWGLPSLPLHLGSVWRALVPDPGPRGSPRCFTCREPRELAGQLGGGGNGSSVQLQPEVWSGLGDSESSATMGGDALCQCRD